MIPPKEFIRKIKPFSFLSSEELDIIVSSMEVNLFNKGETIFKKGHESEYIYIVFSGLIGLYDDESAIDYLSRGEIFGIMSVYGSKSNFYAIAMEESVCYATEIASFRIVFDKNKRFSDFFTTFLERRFRAFKTIASDRKIAEEASFVIEIQRILYKEPVVCKANDTVEFAASQMDRSAVSSVVIIDHLRKPIGILTHKDLRKVIIHGSKSDPVSSYMSSPVTTTSASATIFDAFTAMVDAGIDHLVVTTRGDQICGVVTRKDIQIHLEPSFSIVKLYRKVSKAATIGELATLFRTLRLSVAKIVLGGAGFYDLTKMLCSVHDAVVVKAIQILSKGAGESGFAWIHMGSSGRKEEIIATDQDNALIRSGGEGEPCAAAVTEALEKIGLPLCPGDYMASNDKWNQVLAVWVDYFKRWFSDPIPDHIRYLSVFLDMRPVWGNSSLHTQLLTHVKTMVTPEALTLLAQDAIDLEPPLGMFGIVGLHRGLDLKNYGIYPIVNGTRVLAVDNGLFETTNTRERLEALRDQGVLSDAMCHELIESYGFIQDLRLRRHARAVLAESKPSNRISARDLSKVDLLLLKESLKIVLSFQRFLMKKYDVQRVVLYSQL
jgi:CBS domain-containing protein